MIITGIGVFLAKKNILTESFGKTISTLVMTVTMPAMVMSSVLTQFTSDMLGEAAMAILSAFVLLLASMLIAHLFIWIFRVPKGRRGLFRAFFVFSNAVFIGVPVSRAFFGEGAVHIALYFYIANTFLFWLLAVPGIAMDIDGAEKQPLRQNLKKVLTPPLITFVVSIILVLLNVRLPMFVMSTADYLGSMTTPLALIYSGTIIYNIGKTGLAFNKDVLGVSIGRFVVSPLLYFFVLAPLFGIDGLTMNVMTIQASMPVIVSGMIVTESYGADKTFAGSCFFWTTIIAVAALPVYMMLF